MKKIKIFLTLLSSAWFISCESNTYSEISNLTANPTYEANVAPIIKNNCVNCHFGTSQYPNLETYEGVKNACLVSNLICRIESESCGAKMPLGGSLPQTDIDVIKLWETNGFIKE